jgi:hypothetical protein
VRFTPMGANGSTPVQAPRPGPRLAMYVVTKGLRDPAHPSTGVCGIRTTPLSGLKATGGSVILEQHAYPGLIGQAFVACASTGYLLNNWPILASLLIDAAQPGATPGPLPAMKPISGHAGTFEAPGEEGQQVARRVPGAWLVVSKGQGPQQRLALLEHLRATGQA